MCTSWNSATKCVKCLRIITYWEMCTSWNGGSDTLDKALIITYWEMCTSWNWWRKRAHRRSNYNLLGNVH